MYRPLGQLSCALVKVLAERNGSTPLIALKLHILQEFVGHQLKSIVRPCLKPVNGAAVDERGELAQSIPEGVSDGAHSKNDVKVLPTAVDEVVEE